MTQTSQLVSHAMSCFDRNPFEHNKLIMLDKYLETILKLCIKDNKRRATLALILLPLLGIPFFDQTDMLVLSIGEVWLGKIALTLLILSAGLLFLIYPLIQELRNSPDFSEYEHSPKENCWLNPNNLDDRICSECKSENRLTLLEHSKYAWQCPIHKRIVGLKRDDAPEINRPKRRTISKGFVRNWL